MDDSDYYGRHQAEYGDYTPDSYDSEEAPYESLAPDLTGKSPLKSWQGTEAKPTRFGGNTEEATGSNLREKSVIGASPIPSSSPVVDQPYTIPNYFGAAGAREVESTMGYAPTRNSFSNRSLGVLQKIASGVSSIYDRVGSLFSRSRERSGDVFSNRGS